MTVTSFNINQQLTSVRLASDSNLSGIYYNGQLNNGIGSTLTSLSYGQLIIDTVTVEIGDRILLVGQTNSNENGIYVVSNAGALFEYWKLERSTDFQSLEQIVAGQYLSVDAGNNLAGNMFVVIEPLPTSVGIGTFNFMNVTGSSSGGPFLTVEGNLSDLGNRLEAYQNFGFGSGGFILLTDSDFVGGEYQLTNPCPNFITVLINTPGLTLILPQANQEQSFNLFQGIFLESGFSSSEELAVKSFEGISPFVNLPARGAFKFYLLDNSTPQGNWLTSPVVESVNGKTGTVIIPIVNSTNGIYVSNDGSDITGDGSIINPYETLSFAMSQVSGASSINPISINLLTGNYTETNLSLKSNVFIYGNSSILTVSNQIVLDSDWASGGNGGIFDLLEANFTSGMALNFDISGALNSSFLLKNIISNISSTWAFQGKITTGTTKILIDSIYSFSSQPTILVFDCFGYINNCIIDELNIFNTNTQNTSFYTNNVILTSDLISQVTSSGDLNYYISNSKIFGNSTFSSLSTGSCTSFSNSVLYTNVPIVNGSSTLLNIDLIDFLIVPTGGATVNYVTTAISSWNGSNAPVNITAGDGIDITNGIISLTGSGASAAFGGSWVANNIYTTSFTDATTWKGIRVNNVTNTLVNFIITFDGSNQLYFQYVGTESAKFRIGLANRIRTVNNTSPNSYNYSLGIDSGSGIVPIYVGNTIMPFSTSGNTEIDSIIVPYNIVIGLNPNDKLYPIIQNRGDVNPTNNEYIVTYLLADIEKIGDTGGTLSGVVSLNGLTGTVSVTGSNGSVSVNPSGSSIDLSVGQYNQISGTSQAMLSNINYICMNSSTTSLALPTTCSVGSFINIAGYGSGTGLFTITQSSGQSIFIGTTQTTVGVTGTLSPNTGNFLSSLKLVCVVANTTFMVVSSQGNFVTT